MRLNEKNPESARSVSGPDEPARRSRATSSSVKRLVPPARSPSGASLDDLARLRPDSEEQVVAELVGVAVGGALLVLPVRLDDRRVEVDGDRIAPWAGLGRPGSPERLCDHGVELAEVTKVSERRNVPSVDGAITTKGSTRRIAPARTWSAWSMWLPPARIEKTRVSTFRPGSAPPTRPARRTKRFTSDSRRKADGECRRQDQPGVGHEARVVECHIHPPLPLGDRIEPSAERP
jgi:hypothetical protein